MQLYSAFLMKERRILGIQNDMTGGSSTDLTLKLTHRGRALARGHRLLSTLGLNHIVDTRPLTKFEVGLNLLHIADDDAVRWRESTATATLAAIADCL